MGSRENIVVGEEMEKTMRLVKKFRRVKDDMNSKQLEKAKTDILKRVDVVAEDGSIVKIRRCRDFEAVQLLNLMPRSADEAISIIPTLRDNEFLDDLVSE